MDKQTSLSDITSYNNYYEFGLDKSDPAAHAGKLQTRPWTVSVEGEVGKPRTFDIEELLARAHGRAGLPVALCRRLVHGHSLGGLFAFRPAQTG